MSRPEVADVIHRYGSDFSRLYGESASVEQQRALRDISRCRTAALGGHKQECDNCGHEVISYNSCRNRHCPKCQAGATATWLDKQTAYLLDVEYFHLVFTLPHQIGPIALQNKRAIYGMLFSAAAETLSTIAKDPKHLGAQIGFLAVLHTWGQNLFHHPHVHCVVPGGGISPDGSHWISCRKGFFLPVRVLSRLFRTRFLKRLAKAYDHGELRFSASLLEFQNPDAWKKFVGSLRRTEWVVYAKPPFGGPKQVLKYLARYTHRIAISNKRIIDVADGKVSFSWKDYSQAGRSRLMTLDGPEFIRRFLLHVLPKGFVRIRHYGFLANRVRAEKTEIARELIAKQSDVPPEEVTHEANDDDGAGDNLEGMTCPKCKTGRLLVTEVIPASSSDVEYDDTS